MKLLNNLVNKGKKIIIIFLLICVMIIPICVYATDEKTIVDGAFYQVNQNIETNELPFGIIHQTDSGITQITNDKYINKDSQAAGLGGGGKLIIGQDYTQQVNYLEIPSSEDIKIVPWADVEDGRWTLTKVRTMAELYENEHPGWKVVGAINADFFDINGANPMPYTPSGGFVVDGESYKVSTNWFGLGIDNSNPEKNLVPDHSPTISNKPILAIYDNNKNIIQEIEVNKINEEPLENETSVFFPEWQSQRVIPLDVTDAWIIEEADDVVSFSLTSLYGKGVITKKATQTLKECQFAIKSNDSVISNLLSVGTTVRVQYEYQNNLKDIDEVVGYKSDVLIDGEPFFDATEGYGMDRLPRTIMGKKANGNIAMIVVDGRQPAKGYFGANQGELAAIALHYGLVSAYQFDGGGSSTMIIRKDDELTVVNSPSDGMERSDSDCLLVVARVPALEYTIERDSNSVTFHVNILDNLIKYQDLFIEINDEKKKIVNGEVVFSSLKTYEFYRYYFYGYDGKDYTNIIYSGVINTTKEIPIIENVIVNTIYDQNNLPQYEVKCVVKDPNQALESITIVVGKKIYQINNDVFLIPYEETELLQKDGMFIRIRFNIGDEIMTHVENITSFNLEVKSSTTLLEELKQKINKQINNCY